MTDIVAEKLKLLPDSPGVYIMKDDHGKIIYVGKAIVLKNRVRQYFQSSRNHTPKVRAMVSHIADFETIMTANEVESLILEANLIKKHRPRYNIRLKDDKSYPYVKVTVQEEFPRVFITRRVLRDGARYFGPYTNVTALRDSLKLLRRLFPLRTCRTMPERPCLEYHIKRCLAPCIGKVEAEDYRAMIRAVLLFLEGRTDDVERELEQRMNAAAEAYHFETAARLRDQLSAVRTAAERQNIVTGAGDQDAVGMARSAAGVCVQIFFIRGGKMIGREHFLLRGSEEESDADILRAFLEQYYNQATFVPREVLLPCAIDAAAQATIEAWLAARKGGGKVALLTPECFDISHNQGQETVASMVVFEDGAPKKSDYRRFKIRSTEGKPDDFLSMREVTMRRYVGLPEEELPDLIIIDGGKGQLSSALEIIRHAAGHKDVPVVGLAKQFELVFTEGNSEPVELPRRSQALYLIQRIRDEAHRFAITFHRKLRGKRNLVSVLDHIVGIGPKRRQSLRTHFGSLEKIKEASVEELAAAPGMNRTSAEAVRHFFDAQQELRGKQ